MADWGYGDMPDQTGKIVLITGSNSGLGLACARDFLTKTKVEKVILACRSEKNAQEAMEELGGGERLEFLQLDLADLDSAKSAAKELCLRHDRLDTLVLNAGLSGPGKRATTKQGFELTMGVCHLGHFAFTAGVWPLLLKSSKARVVGVSSMAHTWAKTIDFEDFNWEKKAYAAMGVYSEAKLANVLFIKELGRRMDDAGVTHVTAVVLQPGFANSGFYRDQGCFLRCVLPCVAVGPDKLSLNLMRGATDESLQSGTYLDPKRHSFYGAPVVREASAVACDPALAARLWAKSEECTKQEFKLARE